MILSDNIVFKLLPDGSFIAGDTISGLTSYAYESSEYANLAKHKPVLVAIQMLSCEEQYMRVLPAIAEYDRRNWQRLTEDTCRA